MVYVVNRFVKRGIIANISPPEPLSIYIELTNRCNYVCDMCPLKESQAPRVDMDFNLFKKIIDDIAEWNPDRKSLALHVFGEPFLYKRIFDCLDYIDIKLKRCKIYISTNFSTVSKETIEYLFQPKIYNVNLGIWIDTISPKTYSKQRTGGDYYKVLKNIYYLIDLKRLHNSEYPEFHIGMIITKNNKHEVKSFIRFWEEKFKGLKGAEIRTDISHDWAAQVSMDEVIHKKGGNLVFKNVCPMPFTVMAIFSNGDVGTCCMDVEHKIIIGNAKYKKLKAIWTGSEASKFRRAMASYGLDSFVPCKDCLEYNMPVNYLLEKALFFLKRKILMVFERFSGFSLNLRSKKDAL